MTEEDLLNLLTEADVRALANAQSFDRGFNYFRHNAAFDVARRGQQITGQVEGSQSDPYHVQVLLGDTGIKTATCTCPYDWGGICKHIVAVLLTLIHQPEAVTEKSALSAVLSELEAAQLRQLLLNIAAEAPAFADLIEREATWLQAQPATKTPPADSPVPVDVNATRREIHKDFRLAGKGDPYEYDYYDEYAGLMIYPDEILQPHLEKVTALLDAGDVNTAVSLITAIIDAYIDGLTDLDEWVYEYNEDVLAEANITLGSALAEVLLSLEPDEAALLEWLDQIADWEEGLGDLEIAATAVDQGWTYPPLVAAMEGHITEKGAWEEEAPDYADELALARLRVLAREGRTEAYINLALAEGQTSLGINMMARSGDIAKAVTEAQTYLVYPSQILAVAQILADQNEMGAAIEVAEHGLGMEQTHQIVELARWTREKAEAADKPALALQAARVAFGNSYELTDYRQVQQLAREEWATIKSELLQELRRSNVASRKIDIYLHEKMLTEAMQVLDSLAYPSDHDLHRIIEAAHDQHPDWGIRQCRKKAEAIMDAGQSKSYATAVNWLQIARDIYQQHQRQAEWQTYLDNLLETHHRKYKLVPMLRDIRT